MNEMELRAFVVVELTPGGEKKGGLRTADNGGKSSRAATRQFFAIRISNLSRNFGRRAQAHLSTATMGKRKLGALEKVDADLYGT